jgi:NAD(P)H-hydrate epimerase
MSTFTLTRDQVRAIDRRAIDVYGFSSLVLMENAGRGCADRLEQLGIDGPVAICCGKGNNAGDGFVVARHLELRGYEVRAALWGDPAELTADAGANYGILQKCGVKIDIFTAAHEPERLNELLGTGESPARKRVAWIVDALLGTGARGEPRPPLDAVIDQLNACGAPILAIDLPSGLDCDTGRPAGHSIRAAHTCTFVAAKPGFFAPGADRYTGQLHVHDIGVPRKVIDEVLGYCQA